jgi:hypothetical protein
MRLARVAGKILAAAAVLMMVSFVSAPAEAASVAVSLRSNFVPYDDFVRVRTIVDTSPGLVVVATRELTDLASLDHLATSFERIADIDGLAVGAYHVAVELRDRHDVVVGFRSVTAAVTGPLAVNIDITTTTATSTAQKTWSLLTDNDGDGAVGPNDVLRYTITLRGGGTFEDYAGPGLLNGSVTASAGTITKGNGGGDVSVEVTDVGTKPVTIQYDVQVTPVVANQGRLENGSHTTFTDDPYTPAPHDPTFTPLACIAPADLVACQGRFEGCELRRRECELLRARALRERDEARAQLAALLDDADHDSVPAVLDLCPSTLAGAAVDERGCSRAQFCAAIDLGAPSGRAVCRAADWRNDEPLDLSPNDCRPAGAVCQAR